MIQEKPNIPDLALPPGAVPIPAAASEIASEQVVKLERRDDEPEEENQSERDAPSKGLATSVTDDRRKKSRTENEGCDSFFLVSSSVALHLIKQHMHSCLMTLAVARITRSQSLAFHRHPSRRTRSQWSRATRLRL